MKRTFSILAYTLLVVAFSGCIKNDQVIFTDSQVEFDASTWNANAAGLTHPMMTRVPIYGAASTTSNSVALTRTSGTIRIRVNLVGSQSGADAQFTYKVDPSSTAVAGTHYTALSGTGTIPAQSSFGFIDIPILNPGATSGSKDLILELTDTDKFKVNTNYAKLGLRIAQN